MKHLSEEQLVMLYYGEEHRAEVREHLEACEECRQACEALRATLAGVDLPVPERGDDYGAEVWRRLSPRLAETRSRGSFLHVWLAPRRWMAVAAMAVVVVGAFFAGRFWPRPEAVVTRPVAMQGRERILLVAVGDHLERSQMVLLELVNSRAEDRGVDISGEQRRAQDLIASNRLYRQTAASAGNPGVATVLDDLERVLVEIAHSPSKLSSEEFEDLRRRVEAQGILFKVRVIDSRLRRETRRSL